MHPFVEENVEEAEKPTIRQRLVRGAGFLGTFYRLGQRCTAGWSLMKDCQCPDPSKFCVARRQWIALMKQSEYSNRNLYMQSEFGVVESMTTEEFEESQLTIVLANGVKLGGKKGNVPVKQAREILETGDSCGDALLSILSKFPGSRVVKTKTKEEAEAEATRA